MTYYQIYRNGKPYGHPSTSKEFLEYGLAMLKPVYLNDEWELKEVEESEENK